MASSVIPALTVVVNDQEQILPLHDELQDVTSSVAQSVLSKTQLSDEAIEFSKKHISARDLDISLAHARYADAAVVFVAFGVVTLLLGLINPLFFVGAAVLFMCAAGCALKSRDEKARTLASIRSQINEEFEQFKNRESACLRKADERLFSDKMSSKKTFYDILAGLRQGLEAKTERLLNKYTHEKFEFTPEQLLEDIRNNNFFSFSKGYNYPYSVGTVTPVEEESHQEAIIRTYVKDVLGLERSEKPLRRLEKCAKGLQGDELQSKALQLASFFKLLSQAYQIVPSNYSEMPGWDREIAVNTEIVDYGVMTVNPNLSARAGQFPLTFTVDKELLPLCLTDDLYTKTAEECSNLAVYRTAREYTVCPPDEKGRVECSIRRKFIGTTITQKSKTAKGPAPQFFNRFKSKKVI